MTDALHSELEVAQQRLAECREGRRLDAGGTSPLTYPIPTTSAPVENVVFHLDDHLRAHASFGGQTLHTQGTPHDSKDDSPGGPGGWRRYLMKHLWRLGIFLVDSGLIYFCLLQGTSKETKSSLESLFVRCSHHLDLRAFRTPHL